MIILDMIRFGILLVKFDREITLKLISIRIEGLSVKQRQVQK